MPKKKNVIDENVDTSKRVPRKRKVLQEQNYSDDDSDFEETINNNRMRRAPSPTKKKKTQPKISKTKGKTKADSKKENEDQESQTCPASSVRVKRINMHRGLVSLVHGLRSGLVKRSEYSAAAVRPVIENVARLKVSQLVSPFDRRVTAIAWHPSRPHLAAAGSKVTTNSVLLLLLGIAIFSYLHRTGLSSYHLS